MAMRKFEKQRKAKQSERALYWRSSTRDQDRRTQVAVMSMNRPKVMRQH